MTLLTQYRITILAGKPPSYPHYAGWYTDVHCFTKPLTVFCPFFHPLHAAKYNKINNIINLSQVLISKHKPLEIATFCLKIRPFLPALSSKTNLERPFFPSLLPSAPPVGRG